MSSKTASSNVSKIEQTLLRRALDLATERFPEFTRAQQIAAQVEDYKNNWCGIFIAVEILTNPKLAPQPEAAQALLQSMRETPPLSFEAYFAAQGSFKHTATIAEAHPSLIKKLDLCAEDARKAIECTPINFPLLKSIHEVVTTIAPRLAA